MSDDDLKLRAQGRIGTVLGKYRIDGVLGVGGMAVVFAATHRNQRKVAIKMLHPGIGLHREARERFLREGYAANTVDHPGAVAVLDDDTAEDGSPYLVMERLDGDEVDRLAEARGGRLPLAAVLAIADGLLDVLQAAHAKSIVHRDIKPANLYVTRDGTLKVLDFGIARVRDAAAGGATATKTGMMLGTPSFMSPEQALSRASEIDGRSDIWSAGATVFYLLTGAFVHEGNTVTEVIVQAATQPARLLSAALPGVDPRVASLVDRALAFDKAARWPDAGSMRAAVRAAYQEIFGTRLGREPLEQLFTEVSGTAGTVAVPAVPSLSLPPELAATGAAPPPSLAAPPASLDPRAVSAPAVAISQGPWQAPPSSMGATAAPSAAAAPSLPVVRNASSPSAVAIVAVTLAACAALGGGAVLFLSRTRAPAAAPSASVEVVDPARAPLEPTVTVAAAASAAPPGDTAAAKGTDEPGAEAPATLLGPSAAAPQPFAPSHVTPSRSASPAVTAVHTSAPAPAPTPVYTPPPAVCRAQCADIARACKTVCKQQYRFGHERHQCLVSCESTEKECRGKAPC